MQIELFGWGGRRLLTAGSTTALTTFIAAAFDVPSSSQASIALGHTRKVFSADHQQRAG